MKSARWFGALACLLAVAACTPTTPGGGGSTSTAGKLDRTFAAGYGWDDIDLATAGNSGELVQTQPVITDDGTIVATIEVESRPDHTSPQSGDYFSDVWLVAHRANGVVRARAQLPIVEYPNGSPGGLPEATAAAAPGNRFVVHPGGYNRADMRRVYRYGADLVPDSSFGVGGTVELPATLGPWTVKAVERVAVDGAGRVVLVASATDGSTSTSLLVRLTTSGAFDPAFAGVGWTVLAGSDGVGARYDIDLDVDSHDRIVVHDVIPSGFNRAQRVHRYTEDGQADATFTPLVESGIAFIPISVTLDAADRVLLTVLGADGTRLERYTPTGQLDLAFAGGDGRTPAFDRAISDVQVQASGRILVQLASNSPENKVFMDVLASDGTPATSVGTGGRLELTGAAVAAQESACNDYGSCVYPGFAQTAGGTRLVMFQAHYVSQTVVFQLIAP